MKRLLFVLLLVLSIGLMTAVESEASATVGYVKYDCVSGLNFVAMPMDDGITTTEQIGNAYASYAFIDAINFWRTDTQSWDAALNGDGYWDPDYEVGPGSVMMISTDNGFPFYSIGDMPAANATYDIVYGLTSIMLPLDQSDLNRTELIGDSMYPTVFIDAINFWREDTQSWDAALNGDGYWDPDYATTVGVPMMVSSDGATTWPTRSRGNARSLTPTTSKK